MLTEKEMVWIFIAVLISSLIYGFHKGFNLLPFNIMIGFVLFSIIIFLYSIVKEIASSRFSIEIDIKPWEIERYGWRTKDYLKEPFPIGLAIPLILSFLTLGYIQCFTILSFEEENIPKKRILKKRGIYRKTEMNDSDPAFTSMIGFYSLIVLSIIAIILNIFFPNYFFKELAKYSVFYGIWNLIPISTLDGSKVFFGSYLNWLLLSAVYIFFLIVVILI